MGIGGADIRTVMAALCMLISLQGWAEVAVVVSRDTPVDSMSTSQLQNIFLGRTSHLPGEVRAVPLDQADGNEVRDAFYRDLLGQSPAQVKAHWSKILFTGRGRPPRQVAGDEEVKRLVAATPGMVGYIDAASLDDSVKALELTP